ncbi:MAG TPA: homoserine kinase [Mycobacteriales bacterium]|nr:homoserine kinase [Mycobacteriales bacterium]
MPATSANLGPGFDALGLALALHDDVVVRVADEGLYVDVAGEGADSVPRTKRHLVVRALHAGFDALGGQPRGLEVVCANRIPHSRGLGSSAAAIVAGLVAARALVLGGEDALDDEALLALAAAIEGHPDNVAACLLGGLTLAWTERSPGPQGTADSGPSGGDMRTRAVRLPLSIELRPVAFVPAATSSTARARRLLPGSVPHQDAARNAGRAALLVHALAADPGLLLPATEDRLHQPYRAPALPRSAGLVEALRSAGVPAVISGAGPTVLAFAAADVDLDAYAPRGWSVEVLAVDPTGAALLPLAG